MTAAPPAPSSPPPAIMLEPKRFPSPLSTPGDCCALCFTSTEQQQRQQQHNDNDSSAISVGLVSLGWFASRSRGYVDATPVRSTDIGTLCTSARDEQIRVKLPTDAVTDHPVVAAGNTEPVSVIHSLIPCLSDAPEHKTKDGLHCSAFAVACIVTPVAAKTGAAAAAASTTDNNRQPPRAGVVFFQVPGWNSAANTTAAAKKTSTLDAAAARDISGAAFSSLRTASFHQWLSAAYSAHAAQATTNTNNNANTLTSNKPYSLSSSLSSASTAIAAAAAEAHKQQHIATSMFVPLPAAQCSGGVSSEEPGAHEDVVNWIPELCALLVGCENGTVVCIAPSFIPTSTSAATDGAAASSTPNRNKKAAAAAVPAIAQPGVPSVSSLLKNSMILLHHDNAAGPVVQIATMPQSDGQLKIVDDNGSKTALVTILISCYNKCMIIDLRAQIVPGTSGTVFSFVAGPMRVLKARQGPYGGCSLQPRSTAFMFNNLCNGTTDDTGDDKDATNGRNEEEMISSAAATAAASASSSSSSCAPLLEPMILSLRPNSRMFLTDPVTGNGLNSLKVPPRVPGIRALRDVTSLLDHRQFLQQQQQPATASADSAFSSSSSSSSPCCFALCISKNQVCIMNCFQLCFVALQQIEGHVLQELQQTASAAVAAATTAEPSANVSPVVSARGGGGGEGSTVSARATAVGAGVAAASARLKQTTNSMELALLAVGPHNVRSVQLLFGNFVVLLRRNGEISSLSLNSGRGVQRDFCMARLMPYRPPPAPRASSAAKQQQEQEENTKDAVCDVEGVAAAVAAAAAVDDAGAATPARNEQLPANNNNNNNSEALLVDEGFGDVKSPAEPSQDTTTTMTAAKKSPTPERADTRQQQQQRQHVDPEPIATMAADTAKQRQADVERAAAAAAAEQLKKQQHEQQQQREADELKKQQLAAQELLKKQQEEAADAEKLKKQQQEQQKQQALEQQKKQKADELKKQQAVAAALAEKKRKEEEKAAAAAAAAEKQKQEQLRKEKEAEEEAAAKAKAASPAVDLLLKWIDTVEMELIAISGTEYVSDAPIFSSLGHPQQQQQQQQQPKYQYDTASSDSLSEIRRLAPFLSEANFFVSLLDFISKLCERVRTVGDHAAASFNSASASSSSTDDRMMMLSPAGGHILSEAAQQQRQEATLAECLTRVASAVALCRRFSKILPELFRFAQAELKKPLADRRSGANLFLKDECRPKLAAIVVSPLCFFEYSSLNESFAFTSGGGGQHDAAAIAAAAAVAAADGSSLSNNNNSSITGRSSGAKHIPIGAAAIPEGVYFSSMESNLDPFQRATWGRLQNASFASQSPQHHGNTNDTRASNNNNNDKNHHNGTSQAASAMHDRLLRERLSRADDLHPSETLEDVAFASATRSTFRLLRELRLFSWPIAANLIFMLHRRRSLSMSVSLLDAFKGLADDDTSSHNMPPSPIAGEYLRRHPLPGCQPLITRDLRRHPLPHLLSCAMLIARRILRPSVPFIGAVVPDAQEDAVDERKLSSANPNATAVRQTIESTLPRGQKQLSGAAVQDFMNLAKNVEQGLIAGDGAVHQLWPALPDLTVRRGSSIIVSGSSGAFRNNNNNDSSNLGPCYDTNPLKSAVNIFESCHTEPDALFTDYATHLVLTQVYLPFMQVVLPTKANFVASTMLQWDPVFDHSWIEWAATCPRLREEVYTFLSKKMLPTAAPISKRAPSGTTMSAVLCDILMLYLVPLHGDPRAYLGLCPVQNGGATFLYNSANSSSSSTGGGGGINISNSNNNGGGGNNSLMSMMAGRAGAGSRAGAGAAAVVGRLNEWELDMLLSRRFSWCIHVFLFEHHAWHAKQQNNANFSANSSSQKAYVETTMMSSRSSVAFSLASFDDFSSSRRLGGSGDHDHNHPSSSSPASVGIAPSKPAAAAAAAAAVALTPLQIYQEQVFLARRIRQIDVWLEELIGGIKTFFSVTAELQRSYGLYLLRGMAELAQAFHHGKALIHVEGFNSYVDKFVAMGDVGGLLPLLQSMSAGNPPVPLNPQQIGSSPSSANGQRRRSDLDGGSNNINNNGNTTSVGYREWSYILQVAKGSGLLIDAVHLAIAVENDMAKVKQILRTAFSFLLRQSSGDPQLELALDILQKLGA